MNPPPLDARGLRPLPQATLPPAFGAGPPWEPAPDRRRAASPPPRPLPWRLPGLMRCLNLSWDATPPTTGPPDDEPAEDRCVPVSPFAPLASLQRSSKKNGHSQL